MQTDLSQAAAQLVQQTYPCGCTVVGPLPLPLMCGEHGDPARALAALCRELGKLEQRWWKRARRLKLESVKACSTDLRQLLTKDAAKWMR